MSRLANIITQLIPWILRHNRLVLFLGILLTLISFYYTSKLQVHSNFDELLPDTLPAVQEYHRLENTVGSTNFIVVTVESSSVENVQKFFKGLELTLQDNPSIRYVDYRPPSNFFQKNTLLYIPLPELKEMTGKMRRIIHQRTLKKSGLLMDFTDEPKEEINLDEYEKKYSHLLKKDRFYQNEEGNFFVFLIKPKKSASQTDFTKNIVRQVNDAITQLHPEHYQPPLKVQLTGPYMRTLYENQILTQDASRIVLTALVGIILFLTLYFRRKRTVFLISLPLIMSVTWSMGLAYVLFKYLNLFTSFGCAILLGLGVDPCIHLFHTYMQYRKSGLNTADALISSYARLTRSMMMATITTSFAFFALTISGFKAIFQFGVISGTGIIFCFMSMIFLFPAFVVEFEKIKPLEPRPEGRILKKILPTVQSLILSRPTFILSSLLIVLMITPLFLKGPSFDYNFSHIMAPLNTKALDKKVDSVFSMTVNPQAARTESAEEAQRLAKAIRKVQSENNKTSPEGSTILTTLSLLDFVPPDQPKKIALIEETNRLFTPAVIKNMSPKEKRWFTTFQVASHPQSFTMNELPESILNKFRDLKGEIGRFLYIFPNIDMNSKKFLDLVRELRSIQCKDCQYPFYFSGDSVIFYEILQTLLHQGPLVTLASLLFVLLIFSILFRKIKSILLVFSPLLLALLSLLGIMSFFDIQFSIANLVTIPVLIGSGDDYSIYLFQQYREANGDIRRSYPHSAPGIFASAITTLIGFLSLLVAQNNGVFSAGFLTSLGITLCLSTTLVWFASLLGLKRPRPPSQDLNR